MNNQLDGYDYYHKAIAYFDNIAFSCYNAFANEIGSDHWSQLAANPTKIGVNILYNFGNMWIDLVNYYFFNPETVPQNDWSFFFFYTWGDFFSRFLFNTLDGDGVTTA